MKTAQKIIEKYTVLSGFGKAIVPQVTALLGARVAEIEGEINVMESLKHLDPAQIQPLINERKEFLSKVLEQAKIL